MSYKYSYPTYNPLITTHEPPSMLCYILLYYAVFLILYSTILHYNYYIILYYTIRCYIPASSELWAQAPADVAEHAWDLRHLQFDSMQEAAGSHASSDLALAYPVTVNRSLKICIA